MKPVLLLKDLEGITRCVIINIGENTCDKFLSELANCPFSEQADQQKVWK